MLEYAVYENNQADLSFLNAKGGLILKNSAKESRNTNVLYDKKTQEQISEKEDKPYINALTVYVDDHILNESLYDALLKDNHILITFKSIQPKAGTIKISFARTSYYKVNIYNMADIPMKPFEVKI